MMDRKEATKLIAFFTMSDGCLFRRGSGNASFILPMLYKHIDILEYLYPVFDYLEIGYKVTTVEKGGGRQTQFRFETKTHPFLTTIYERIYLEGRKQPSPHDFKLLDWESLTILYMCDGSLKPNYRNTNVHYSPVLCLNRWNYAELTWVSHKIKETLMIDTSLHSKNSGRHFDLAIPKKSQERFFAGIAPFITDSFLYKLPSNGKPQDNLGDEIVRPVGKPTDTDGNDLYL
jgi:hypothetical protein